MMTIIYLHAGLKARWSVTEKRIMLRDKNKHGRNRNVQCVQYDNAATSKLVAEDNISLSM
jgi:hypothetical protein